ncbi:MAG TPA: alkene reductase [Planctomycetota bacterium]|nr:alkene reductase [Planctomycetota bacterium]
MSHEILFTPVRAGALQLPNRIVMAPMTRNRAGAGHIPTALTAAYYRQRATAGLIVTEATQVSPRGIGYPNTPGIHTAEQVEGWRAITTAVHDAGGRIVLQLWHVGRSSHPLYQPHGDLPVSSSAIAIPGQLYTPEGMKPYPVPRALDSAEIPGVVAEYARGAANAKAAGFDGVEIHGANGYLIDQFLRDGVNRRTDSYGGSLRNRLRFMKEVATAVADAWEPSRVGIRLSPSGTFNGMSDSDPVATFSAALEELSELKLAYVHVVEPGDADLRHGGPAWKSASARQLRRHFRGTYITAGEMTKEKAAALIHEGLADAAAFARLYISNPDLVERFRRGAAIAPSDSSTYYGGTEKGYTDYPALA